MITIARHYRHILFPLLCACGIGIGVWLLAGRVTQHQSHARVYFFDVGQGDAALIRLPRGYDVLIDAGPDKTIAHKLGKSLPFFDRTLEAVILTHPHADHITGLLEILRRYEVQTVITTGVAYESPVATYLQEELTRGSIRIEIVAQPQTLELPTGRGDRIEVRYPVESIVGKEVRDVNTASMVVSFTTGGETFLFMGDAYRAQEDELLAAGSVPRAVVLKVGHHGSVTSTGLDFLDAVQPRYAIISVGSDNPYGHPHAAVLDRLREKGITVVRTDQSGDITFLMEDGGTRMLAGE
ncbi:MAG: hypothetical protein AUK21_04195 [Parcubacteria group bacterium CG2_30_48_51]|nr:MAG: hypothetical protein AUK21_04195 [Parcubacteria group bacterium CG2_30_48_51]